jgi:hypothetical protein
MAFALWLYAVGSVAVGLPQAPFLARMPPAVGFASSVLLMGGSFFAFPFVLIPFVLRFPTGRIDPAWRWVDVAAWAAFPLFFVGGGLLVAAAMGGYIGFKTVYAVTGVCGQLLVPALMILLFRYTRMAPHERAQTAWALVAFGGSFLALEASVVVSVLGFTFSMNVDDATNLVLARVVTCLATLGEVLPLLAIYPILRYRLFDLGFVVSRATLYSVLTIVVVGLLAGVNWLAQRVVTERVALVIQPVAAIFIGLGYMRIRGWTQSALERTLFRERYRAEAELGALAERFSHEPRAEEIDAALTAGAAGTLALSSAAIFRRRGARMMRTAAFGWEGASFDDAVAGRGDAHQLLQHDGLPAAPHEPVAAIELVSTAELVGIAFYGRHGDGTEIDPAETAMLRRLCDAAATAYRVAELQSEVAQLRRRPNV